MTYHEALFPPGATARDWANDVLLAGSLSLASVVSATFYGFHLTAPQTLFLMVASLTMTLPLALRRHSPLLTLALCTVGGLVQFTTLNAPTLSLTAVPIVAYSVARWVPGNLARVVLVVGALGAVLGPLAWFNVQYPAGVTAYILYWGACMGAVIAPYAFGRRFRELFEARELQEAADQEKYRLLLAEREQQARLGEASTRAMIARELHDIVAHSLSVMIVQAEGGRAASGRRPEAAQEALTTIAETGREALGEMRRIVGVLRAEPGADAATYAPAPRLSDLPDLVQRATDRADLAIYGVPYPVSGAVELTAYRVAQEALTNVLKHAGKDAHVHVSLSYEPSRLVVDVVDDGRHGGATGDGAGSGLRGMYERVSSMGGTLHAGPLAAGGFRVTALIPRQSSPQRPAATATAPMATRTPATPAPSPWPPATPAPSPWPPAPPQSLQPPPGGAR